jgi:GNAT superfamily N-acetyltransferase
MNGLRYAVLADVPALQRLISRSGRELSLPYYTPVQAEAITCYVFGVDSQLIEDRTYFVIEQDDLITACGGWSKRQTLFGGDQAKTGPDPLLDPSKDPARVRAFFVDPARARQGLGRRLMQECAERARASGFKAMELVSTLSGEPLYLASGFVISERFELSLPGGVQVTVSRMRRLL